MKEQQQRKSSHCSRRTVVSFLINCRVIHLFASFSFRRRRRRRPDNAESGDKGEVTSCDDALSFR